MPPYLRKLVTNANELVHYLQRAIGVIYRPDMERLSHYYFTRLPYPFDCLIHLDKHRRLSPYCRKRLPLFKDPLHRVPGLLIPALQSPAGFFQLSPVNRHTSQRSQS
ncbi:erythromycin esterase family protein [Legionella taurinensis]